MKMNRQGISFLFAAVAAAGLGCSGALDGTASPGIKLQVTRLRSEPYPFAVVSGLRQSTRIIVRDDATWQSLWSTIWIGASPVPAAPAIDFSREMLVVAALGSRSTGGFGILVDSAARASDGITVWIRTIAPGPSCGTTQAFTQPVDLARLPRIDAVVRFTDTPVVTDCH
jgi:hypothetical protein